ncbi:aminotransferase class IV [Clostridium sp. UBA1056]|uniref:aminotransferase class IV n=1 Tax=unclassified Clostridium TaxID=2614128 RepID=UPI0032162734
MDNCINDYFIKNDEVYERAEFQDIYVVEGKCIYEVIRVIDGAPLFLNEHLERLENSLKLEKKEDFISMDMIKDYIEKLITINRVVNGNLKLVLNKDNLFIFFIKHSYPTKDMYNNGVKTILYFGERHNPNAKVIDNSFREKVNEKIAASNSYEAILVNHEGYITEGSKSNIFMVKGDEIITAPVEGVLPGITRGEIIKACHELGLKVKEENINCEDIKNLDGLFISGTSPNVLPINEVQGIIKYDKICDKIYNIKDKFEQLIIKNLKNYKITK